MPLLPQMFPPPLIIGHRGASAVAPENTIAAFDRAFEDGADGIEFDVQLARDGVPVIIHDSTLRRTAGLAGSVADFTAAELGKVDAGSWFNRQYPKVARPQYESETIPTLSRLFKSLPRTGALCYLEMKSAGDREATPLAAAVVELIREYSLVDRVIVSSFDLSALKTTRTMAPEIRVAALFEPRLRRPLAGLRLDRTVDLAREIGAAEVSYHRSLVRPRIVQKAASLGLRTVVWTVNDWRWIRRAQRLGIVALITNKPATMARARSQIE